MRVVVDDREMKSGVVENLRSMEGVCVEVERLDLGDYLVDDRVLFERKTVADFAKSLVDGRLFGQACRLTSSRFHPVLILEGSAGDLTGCGVRRESIQGAMVMLTVILHLPLLRSLDVAETARLIRYTGEQIERSMRGVIARPGNRPADKRKRQLFILQGLPGIGSKRAEKLLDAFGTVEAVVKADTEALAAVEGVGDKTADAIRQALSEDRALYGNGGGREKWF
jgi:ERCC4-type nuclease